MTNSFCHAGLTGVGLAMCFVLGFEVYFLEGMLELYGIVGLVAAVWWATQMRSWQQWFAVCERIGVPISGSGTVRVCDLKKK